MQVREARRRRLLAGAVALATCLATACQAGGDPPEPEPVPSTPAPEARLTFGVWGPADEVAGYESMVAEFNATSEESDVAVEAYDDRAGLVAELRGDGTGPDVFLLSRADLAWLSEEKINVPVDELLDERGVEFGDRYARSALEAFSADQRLQCMPYGISPMVLFFNTELVDFERMERRGLDVPPEDDRTRWSFEQFEEAVRFATRKRRGTKGVAITPSLRSVAPFVYSGGGNLFDDDEDPTSLTLSDGDSEEALERVLTVLRDPTLTLTEAELERRSPLEWFKRGRVGMIEGERGLVPELRGTRGLDFDVMPMPTLDSPATVGEITGLCISADAASVPEAADFLVHALSTEAVARVTQAGYLVPANQEVALTDDFLQPGRQPVHAEVFNSSVRDLRVPPLIDRWTELDAAVQPLLTELFEVPVLDDLEAYTEQIDEISRGVLAPEPSESPSEE